MKKLLSIIFLFAVLFVKANTTPTPIYKPGSDQLEKHLRFKNGIAYFATTYYVNEATGSDGNAGTIGSPFETIEHLETVMIAGDNAYIRGGTYTSPRPVTDEYMIWIQGINGTLANPCRIENYPGETVVVDYSYINPATTTNDLYGFYLQNSNYLTIKGIRITGMAQPSTGNSVSCFVLDNCNNVTIEFCEVDNSGGYGFRLSNSNDNLLLNNDAHHLGDNVSGWGGANGFGITGDYNTSARNTLRFNRAWWNSDDGFDFFGSRGLATLEGNWSFRNGWQPGTSTIAGDGAGFKLGRGYDNGGSYPQNTNTILRVLRNNLAFENRYAGFDENLNVNLQFAIQLDNNTAWQNGTNNTVGGYAYTSGYNYAMYPTSTRTHVIRNNISYVGTDLTAPNATYTTNSWQVATMTSGDFTSLTSSAMDDARGIDGSLPNNTFLKLVAGDCVDVGTNIGLPFNGSAPDLGAFELGENDGNDNPVANAGIDQSVAPTTCELNGTGSTDADGTISTYAWVKLSGTGSTIVTASSATTSIIGLTAGVYVFQLTVTDNDGATGVDTITVTVIESADRIIIIK